MQDNMGAGNQKNRCEAVTYLAVLNLFLGQIQGSFLAGMQAIF